MLTERDMSGAAMPQAAASGGTISGLSMAMIQQLPDSLANSYRVATVAERLVALVLQPRPNDVLEFFNLCLSLARGIDFAVANNEVPTKAQVLPSVLKQVCQRRNEMALQAAIMVLMFSIKSACKVGWFSVEAAQELLALANEVESGFLGPTDINSGPSDMVSTVSTIMTRFHPLMKMGQILASLEVEPGYGAHMVDFHISKKTTYSPQEKIRLFVAQTDKIETSACIISPQEVNFLINGRGVERRTNVFMDTGPQLPTNVSPMLKYGTNLLQAVGQFNGHYVILVAFMSMASSLDSPILQAYVQSGIAMQDSDSELIEGPSRISLNCPISYTRIKTPVKGHSCKHLQCFDFSNFIDINTRRPSWRCPHCNQHVCYTDIRVDQNMVKVLREVGDKVSVVIISADGSWKAILESDDNVDQSDDKILSSEKEGFGKQQSNGITNSDPLVLDLTNDDDEMDAVSTGEMEDRKPDLQSQPVTTNLTRPSELNNTVAVNQNVVCTGDDFWSEFLYPNGSASTGAWSDAQTVISEPTPTNFLVSPVLTDAVSPALNREGEALGYSNLTNSIMQSPYSSPDNLQLQQTQFVSPIANHEYGRPSVLRHVNRTPIAVQALPAPSQTSTPQQGSGTNSNVLTPDGSSIPSNGFSDIERQQQFTRSHMNTFLGTDMSSSPLQHHLTTQPVGLQGSGAHPGAYSVSSGLSTENRNLHMQRALNLRMPPPRSPSPSRIQSFSPHSRTPAQQGSALVGLGRTAGNGSSQPSRFMTTPRAVRTTTQMTRQPPTVPVQVQTSNAGPRFPMNVDGVRASREEQRGNIGGMMQPVRADNLTELPSEQSWRPTGRMRGSLAGRTYADSLGHLMIRPTQSAQPARPQTNLAPLLPRVPGHVQAFLGNRSRPHVPELQTTTGTASVNQGSGVLPERSLGMH